MTADEERGFPPHVLDAAFGPDAKPVPRWLAGLIARYGQPVTYQPKPIRLGACRYQTWAWVGLGVQVEQTLSAFTVSAHRKGRMARLAGLTEYPTDADISAVVALAGLDDAPEVAPAPGPPKRRAAATGGGPCPTCGKPFWTHVCLTCSPDAQTPGQGCHNCRNTGMDQTPCAPRRTS